MSYTIVIPVYNKEETLYKAVNSALNQTLPPDEVLVVDDASTDHSLLALEPFMDNPCLKLIQMPQNSGTAKVLNKALEHINTPYFLQLDGDDWLEPVAGEKLVTALQKNQAAAFAYGNHMLWEYNANLGLKPVKQLIQPPFNNKYDFLLKLGYMLNPRCYRTEYVRKLGGFDTDDPWEGRYYEDARMVIRLAEYYEWIHVPEILHNVLIDRKKSAQKIPMYNRLRKEFYEKMLQKWGNEYLPVWHTASTGRIILQALIPNPKRHNS